jgi:hypothetical protein
MIIALLSHVLREASTADRGHMIASQLGFPTGLAGLQCPIPPCPSPGLLHIIVPEIQGIYSSADIFCGRLRLSA